MSLTHHDHAIEKILTLRHPNTTNQPSVYTAPLTLIEDTLTCTADFLILQAISSFIGHRVKNDNSGENAAAAAGSSVLHPAVVLCTFKQSATHYTHIARKWGVPFAPLQSNGSLYLIEDMGASPSSTGSAASFENNLDAWFQTGAAESTGSSNAATTQPAQPSPLQSFVRRIHEIRQCHSSLLLIVDDLQYLFLHAGGGEIEVLDALVSLQISLAAADAAVPPPTAVLTNSATQGAFSIDSTSAPTVSSSPLPSGIVLVAHGDVPVSPVLAMLRRHASTFLKLNALQTGYTKEISGVLSVQQHHLDTDYWTPIQRSHYKLAESHVKISAPGHSSSTLQQ